MKVFIRFLKSNPLSTFIYRKNPEWRYLALSYLAFIYILLLLAGFAIMLWPEQHATPLVHRGGWKVTGGFFTGGAPNSLEVRDGILDSTEAMFWRSWSPATLATKGKVESEEFTAPQFIALPVCGFPNEVHGMLIYLERMDTGDRLIVVNARMNTQWAEVDLKVPARFRASPVRLVAESSSDQRNIGVGTPFQISRISYLKSKMPALLSLHAICFGCFILMVFAAQILASRFISHRYGFPIGIGFACLAGYFAFFVFYICPVAGMIYSTVFFAGSFMVILSRRLRTEVLSSVRTSWDYYVVWFLVSLFYVLVLYMVDTGAGSWHANSRFIPARWSSDNQISMFIAENIFLGKIVILKDMLSPWHLSDRPPLLAGLMAMARVPFEIILKMGLSNSIKQYFYNIFGIVANSLWAPVFVFGFRKIGLRDLRSLACTFVAAFLPFTIFNSIYCWPKLLSGSLALLSFIVLFVGFKRSREKSSRPNVPFYVAAMLAALALMCHGGAVFGLLALLMWILAVRYFPSPRHFLGIIALFIAIILPWMLWQKLYDPPVNTLLLYGFVGQFYFEKSGVGVLQMVLNAYSRLTFRTWWAMKMQNVGFLLGIPDGIKLSMGLDEMVLPNGCSERCLPQIVRDFYFFLPSLGLLPLSIFTFSASKMKKNFKWDLPSGVLNMLIVGLLSLALAVLIMWPAPVVHQLPYQAELGIVLALLLLLAYSFRILGIIAGLLIMSYGLVVWIIEPSFTALRYDIIAIILLIFEVIWVMIWLFRRSKFAPLNEISDIIE